MVPEERQQDDDRKGNSKQPKKCASTKTHENLHCVSVLQVKTSTAIKGSKHSTAANGLSAAAGNIVLMGSLLEQLSLALCSARGAAAAASCTRFPLT
jgi:hypothetical protein